MLTDAGTLESHDRKHEDSPSPKPSGSCLTVTPFRVTRSFQSENKALPGEPTNARERKNTQHIATGSALSLLSKRCANA